ncbi:DUF5011 domain-containing protein [Candidatus Xianfuyuplasma coldseepsis]|uniref:DUF5011 domain-containing protein n=1 Tax=Candidatus Xianfuyuplasma coldseepsis TaxID=2782163 RepID=A0A7L7KUM1_9MOLU|nr:DUF5011 domain-containing protein [Xianfuyuplasma coldseepsis]QMS85972.1 DUF5011 domain-containing protein [Xianfuyuplasma coldseepsis]
MRKQLMVMLLLILLSVTSVRATGLATLLPGGKNYIDEANTIIVSDRLSSDDPIRVKPLTSYVLWFPPESILANPYINIYNNDVTFVEGDLAELTNCTGTTNYTYCTFNTGAYDTVEFDIFATGWQQYIDFYGFQDIQLEEGLVPTAYESYVAPATDVTDPTFQGSALFVKSYTETISIDAIIDQYIIAYDDIDGDITDSITVLQDNYTTNQTTVGEYNVVLQAEDSSGNTATFDLDIIVQDLINPMIYGPPVLNVDVDEQPSLATILDEQFSFIDGHDGDLGYTVEMDYYTPNKATLGSYIVTVSTVDNSGNEANMTFSINVKDTTAPSVVNTTITTPASMERDLETIVTMIDTTDNYDDNSDILVSIVQDDYTSFEHVVGSHTVTMSLEDTSGNIRTEMITIDVLDDISPLINGETIYTSSYTSPPSISDIINTLNVSDNASVLQTGDITVIADHYTNRETSVGNFVVTVEVLDEAQNRGEFTFTIQLIDDVAPQIIVDNLLISVTPQAIFSPRDALQVLIENKDMPKQDYTIEILEDEYTGHETQEGVYSYSVKYVGANGVEYVKDFNIQVAEPNAENYWSIVRPVIVYSITVIIAGVIIHKMKK